MSRPKITLTSALKSLAHIGRKKYSPPLTAKPRYVERAPPQLPGYIGICLWERASAQGNAPEFGIWLAYSAPQGPRYGSVLRIDGTPQTGWNYEITRRTEAHLNPFNPGWAGPVLGCVPWNEGLQLAVLTVELAQLRGESWHPIPAEATVCPVEQYMAYVPLPTPYHAVMHPLAEDSRHWTIYYLELLERSNLLFDAPDYPHWRETVLLEAGGQHAPQDIRNRLGYD